MEASTDPRVTGPRCARRLRAYQHNHTTPHGYNLSHHSPRFGRYGSKIELHRLVGDVFPFPGAIVIGSCHGTRKRVGAMRNYFCVPFCITVCSHGRARINHTVVVPPGCQQPTAGSMGLLRVSGVSYRLSLLSRFLLFFFLCLGV